MSVKPYRPSGPFYAVISMIVILLIGAVSLYFIHSAYSDSVDTSNVYLGKQVVVGSDTVTVTGFDLYDDEFYLSNGVSASSDYIKRFAIE